MGPETDEMSVEFTRLTENDRLGGSSGNGDGATARISYSTRSKRSDMRSVSLLQEIATKQNIG